MITTVLELWNGQWWRWYLKDGKPYAFVQEGKPSLDDVRRSLDFDLSDLGSEDHQHTGAATRMWEANFRAWKECNR